MAVFIIEHLEPELGKWCLIEYEHISKTVGKSNLWFTNVRKKSDIDKLSKFGKVFSDSVSKLKLGNACVLDPEAKETLTSKDKFDYYIFGGILGDYPPRKRTGAELTSKMEDIPVRNIGKEQMSTDNAVYVVKQISSGKNLNEMKFADKAIIEINKIEEVELPYKYAIINGKPFMSQKLVKFLKEKKGF